MSKIRFHFQTTKYNIKDRSGLKQTVEHLFKREKRELVSLNYIFCTDKYLLSINRAYLKHDYLTDIISFDLSSQEGKIEGEIYISVDRVLENAQLNRVSRHNELCRVIFHGALHLCGYSDKKKIEIAKMRSKEEEYISYYLRSNSLPH